MNKKGVDIQLLKHYLLIFLLSFIMGCAIYKVYVNIKNQSIEKQYISCELKEDFNIKNDILYNPKNDNEAFNIIPISEIENINTNYLNNIDIPFSEIGIIGSDINIIVYEFNVYEDYPNKKDGQIFIDVIKNLFITFNNDGISIPAAVAQAYTEGGAGKDGVYIKSNNLFGIMATSEWDGYVYSRDLKQTYISYDYAKQCGANILFRAYDNIEESIKDYIDLIKTSNRYSDALYKSPKEYINCLVLGGYGDKNMKNVWFSIIKMYSL